MDAFDVAQSFVEYTTGDHRPSELGAAFQDAIERLGFRHFACCTHTDPLSPPPSTVVLHNYPADWATEFVERKLFRIDPVLLHAEQTLPPLPLG